MMEEHVQGFPAKCDGSIDKRDCSMAQRDQCTDTVASELDAAVSCWLG